MVANEVPFSSESAIAEPSAIASASAVETASVIGIGHGKPEARCMSVTTER